MARRKSTVTPDILWDPRLGSTGRYVSKQTGQMVSIDIVQDALERNIDRARAEMARISQNLAEGNMSLANWRVSMANEMRTIHTQSGALAKGGWAQMSQADWGFVGSEFKKQLRFLDDFAMEIQNNPGMLLNLQDDINGNFMRRAELYADAGNTTATQMERRQAIINGIATHEMRLLDPGARHCNCCLGAANVALPLGETVVIGACTCTTKCRCTRVFGTMVDGEFRQI